MLYLLTALHVRLTIRVPTLSMSQREQSSHCSHSVANGLTRSCLLAKTSTALCLMSGSSTMACNHEVLHSVLCGAILHYRVKRYPALNSVAALCTRSLS